MDTSGTFPANADNHGMHRSGGGCIFRLLASVSPPPGDANRYRHLQRNHRLSLLLCDRESVLASLCRAHAIHATPQQLTSIHVDSSDWFPYSVILARIWLPAIRLSRLPDRKLFASDRVDWYFVSTTNLIRTLSAVHQTADNNAMHRSGADIFGSLRSARQLPAR